MIKDILELMSYFPGSYINQDNELILIPSKNVFFQLDDVNSRRDLCFKLLAWCSYDLRKSPKHLTYLNYFLKQNFDRHDMDYIYQKLGNGIKQELAYMFIDSEFDMEVLHG